MAFDCAMAAVAGSEARTAGKTRVGS